MRMFYSVGTIHHLRILLEFNRKNILLSFAYRNTVEEAHELLKMNEVKLFFDSGAFTAWNSGKEVDIEAYKRDLKQFDDIIDVAANVDVIPGAKGRLPTPDEIEQAGELGWKNFEMFRNEGYNKVIHIFHQGDNFKWLHKLLAECEYFGVSPSNDETTESKERWLDHVFRKIDEINPKAKTHAFGVTSERLMTRYPWYSVDSSSWSLSAGFGNALIKDLGPVYFSTEKLDDPKRYNNLEPAEQMHLKRECDKYGLSFKQLEKEPYHRCRMNIVYFKDLEEKINASGPTCYYNNQRPLFDIANPEIKVIGV